MPTNMESADRDYKHGHGKLRYTTHNNDTSVSDFDKFCCASIMPAVNLFLVDYIP